MPTFPDSPFLLADPALGISRTSLRAAIARGDVRRVLNGVGVRGDVEDTVLLRARAAQLLLGVDTVVVDHSAAWLHGVDVGRPHLTTSAPLEVADLTGVRATRRGGTHGCKRSVPLEDVTEVHGVLVTSPARTAADLACRRGRLDAMAALDAFGRVHGVGPAQHGALVSRFAGRRGVTQYRELVPLIDPRAESPRESWTRLSILDAGLPGLEPQVDVYVPGAGWVRLDLANRRLRIFVEYDGAEHHGSADQQEHDRRRRQPLINAGWVAVIVRAGDFDGAALNRWLGELRTAYDARMPSDKRRWARGEAAGRHPRRS